MTEHRRNPRTAIDLFAGAGGLTAGLRLAGVETRAAVEIDADAGDIYSLNHPDVQLLRSDIRKITGPQLLRAARLRPGQLDLLAACPPCQGFSSLRTHNGARRNRDKRNDLVLDILRLTRSIRPKTIMMENVPGLQHDRRFRTLTSGLERIGYHVIWKVLDVADYGVPQQRKRLVMLGSRTHKPMFAVPDNRRRSVRDTIGKLVPPERSRDRFHNYHSRRSRKVEAIIKAIPKDGGSRNALPEAFVLDCHRETNGFSDVYGRMRWDIPSPTITSGCINPSKGRFLHPEQNRPISLREAAMLQSFPRKYKFIWKRGRYSLALMIGNALPPQFIKRHAIALLDGL